MTRRMPYRLLARACSRFDGVYGRLVHHAEDSRDLLGCDVDRGKRQRSNRGL